MAKDGRPTIDTVAAEAGVSRMTVSNAYNRPDQLSAATREKVLAAAAKLGYAGPDPTAASLRSGRTGTVGVVLTERLPYAFTDPGMVRLLHGMTSELSDAGMALLLLPESSAGTGAAVRHAMVDALILCSLVMEDPAVPAALDRQVPLVTAGSPRLPKVPMVGVDNRTAAALMAPHLQSLGHRRFAVLTVGARSDGVPVRPGFVERPAGFIEALRGVDAADVTICEARENSREAGLEAVTPLLALPRSRRPTAIFAVTDILALGALDAAASAGVDVPGELSVAGYDNIPEAVSAAPPLTTIDQDLFGQGRAAARLALRQIAGEVVRAPRFTAELVLRASTARAAR